MRNIKLTIQYDGTHFCGWQRQAKQRTVQQVIEDALLPLVGSPVTIVGSGRTDTGVHARAQVAHFHTESLRPPETFLAALNASLPKDVAITEVSEVELSFHAQRHVRRKCYQYVVWNHPTRPVFERHFSYYFPAPLDVNAMDEAARHLVGEHDFRGFARAAPPEKNCVRSIYELSVRRDPPRVLVTIWGNGFLYTMVRTIVGTLLRVGTGRASPRDVADILESRSRPLAGPAAPPQGLTLLEVLY